MISKYLIPNKPIAKHPRRMILAKGNENSSFSKASNDFRGPFYTSGTLMLKPWLRFKWSLPFLFSTMGMKLIPRVYDPKWTVHLGSYSSFDYSFKESFPQENWVGPINFGSSYMYALCISGGLRALANQVEELLFGITDRKARYHI